MNTFNRLIMILLLLGIIVLTTVIAIEPAGTFEVLYRFFEFLHRESANYLDSQDELLFAVARVIVGGAIIILCMIILWLELRRPRKKTIRVQKLAGGEAHVTVESIAQRLAYNVDQLPDVIKVSPRIEGRARGVDVDLLLETSPDIDVPMKTEEVLQVAREVMVERMGLKVGKVRVKIKHAPFPKE
jgi:hypothetical protein